MPRALRHARLVMSEQTMYADVPVKRKRPVTSPSPTAFASPFSLRVMDWERVDGEGSKGRGVVA